MAAIIAPGRTAYLATTASFVTSGSPFNTFINAISDLLYQLVQWCTEISLIVSISTFIREKRKEKGLRTSGNGEHDGTRH